MMAMIEREQHQRAAARRGRPEGGNHLEIAIQIRVTPEMYEAILLQMDRRLSISEFIREILARELE